MSCPSVPARVDKRCRERLICRLGFSCRRCRMSAGGSSPRLLTYCRQAAHSVCPPHLCQLREVWLELQWEQRWLAGFDAMAAVRGPAAANVGGSRSAALLAQQGQEDALALVLASSTTQASPVSVCQPHLKLTALSPQALSSCPGRRLRGPQRASRVNRAVCAPCSAGPAGATPKGALDASRARSKRTATILTSRAAAVIHNGGGPQSARRFSQTQWHSGRLVSLLQHRRPGGRW